MVTTTIADDSVDVVVTWTKPIINQEEITEYDLVMKNAGSVYVQELVYCDGADV